MINAIIGGIIGGGIGFLYYKLVGCPGGSCPITSNPYRTIVYGAVVGVLFTL